MMKLTHVLTAAALAASAAAPGAAQYYPQPQPYPYPQPQPYPYPQPYPQPYPAPGYGYGYGNSNVLGQIIDGLIGNRWNVNDRQAIRQCTIAAVNQAENRYRPYFGPNWRRPYQGYNGYIRVSQITDVQRRSNGIRVRGLLDTGLYGNRGYGGGYGYGDLSFRCDVDYRGYVSNIRINRNNGYGRY
jgi:hypothetical protein